jgi:hypothetical protein
LNFQGLPASTACIRYESCYWVEFIPQPIFNDLLSPLPGQKGDLAYTSQLITNTVANNNIVKGGPLDYPTQDEHWWSSALSMGEDLVKQGIKTYGGELLEWGVGSLFGV